MSRSERIWLLAFKFRLYRRHFWFMLRSHIYLAILTAICLTLETAVRVRGRSPLPTHRDLLWAGVALWPLLWWLFHFPHVR